jgi:acid stress chaperone HdeA
MLRPILGIGAALAAGMLIVHPAGAAGGKKASEWTCQDFLAVDDDLKPLVIYWMKGYDSAGKPDTAEVDVAYFDQPITTVVTECQKDPKAGLWDKIKNFLSNL